MTMQDILPAYSQISTMPYLDPLFKQTIKSLDALNSSDIRHIGFDPIDEVSDSEQKPTRTECVVTCKTPPIARTRFSSNWPLHLTLVGQASTVKMPMVQETGARGILPATTAGLWLEARRDIASRIQWQQMLDVLEGFRKHFPLVDELDTTALFAVDAKTGEMRILTHTDTEVRPTLFVITVSIHSDGDIWYRPRMASRSLTEMVTTSTSRTSPRSLPASPCELSSGSNVKRNPET